MADGAGRARRGRVAWARLGGRLIACTPVGALAGGALGQHLGIVPTLMIGAGVGALALAWIAAGPVRLTSVRRADAAPARA